MPEYVTEYRIVGTDANGGVCHISRWFLSLKWAENALLQNKRIWPGYKYEMQLRRVKSTGDSEYSEGILP